MSAECTPPQAPTTPQAAEGRDARARFAKANGEGPDNPFARKVGALRSALVNAVSEVDLAQIALTLKAKALAGVLAAIKLLFQSA